MKCQRLSVTISQSAGHHISDGSADGWTRSDEHFHMAQT